MKKAIVISCMVLMTSCGIRILIPKQRDANAGAAKFPGLTLAQLKEGRAMFKHKCSQCHPAKRPVSRDEATWRHIVPIMAAKAQKKGKEEISPADQEIILKYLVTMSDAHRKK